MMIEKIYISTENGVDIHYYFWVDSGSLVLVGNERAGYESVEDDAGRNKDIQRDDISIWIIECFYGGHRIVIAIFLSLVAHIICVTIINF